MSVVSRLQDAVEVIVNEVAFEVLRCLGRTRTGNTTDSGGPEQRKTMDSRDIEPRSFVKQQPKIATKNYPH